MVGSGSLYLVLGVLSQLVLTELRSHFPQTLLLPGTIRLALCAFFFCALLKEINTSVVFCFW